MSPSAPLPPAAKTPRKRSSKPKKTGPTVSDLIMTAVSASKERGGVSLVALKKALAVCGYDVVKNNARVKIAIKRLVSKGGLIQTKGTGASGSFKANKQVVPKKKKPAKKRPAAKAKKPAAKKRKVAPAKKTSGAKKSPKKATKKPAAAKKPKSPKKTKKPKARMARTPKAAKPMAATRKTTRAKTAVAQ
ncbi:hypothetical protein AAFF_G00379230 [Aldrovandia affinis]|uniref:Histone H1 n=1 Tax=Aldrovandia affinis TaxID=143900 RepID=A0AAD7WLN4_9TELE|nr:hypothetical protein AAFF_G00379230 [Aldrovandia affinis]